MSFEIRVFSPKDASEDLWNAFFDYDEKIFQEKNPGDIPPNREFEKSFMVNFSPLYDIYRWLVFTEDSTIIGKGNLWFQNERSADYEGVKEKTYLYLSIAKEHRRKGIAKELLKVMLVKAQSLNKSIIRAEITGELGASFCQHLGGQLVAKRATNRLFMKEVDWDLMDQWRQTAQKKAPGIKIELFQDVPQKDLEEYCALYTEVANQAPAEDLAGEMLITPAVRRTDEEFVNDKGVYWLTMITREPSGEISGLTEMFHHPDNPQIAEQELTGVKIACRGRGLGKWLKAEMLFYIRERFPTVEFIDTGNNDRNEAMLSINTRMGFKRHQTQTFFEFDLSTLRKRLD
ncbi:MAG: GNAT family N-acetyltransferase [Candidatus Thorarchaeota archaeon]